MADDRRKLTDSDIIADQKSLTAADLTRRLPTKGSHHFATAFIQYPPHDEGDRAIDVSQCGDRGLFLLH